MLNPCEICQGLSVALRKESVDRNLAVWAVEQASSVALRKESVDRNVVMLLLLTSLTVALRKESVDRNKPYSVRDITGTSSLSARRAWIEILSFGHIFPYNQGRSPQGERG